MGTWGGVSEARPAARQPSASRMRNISILFGSFFFEKSKMKRYCVSAIEILLIDLKY
jgi:hypothetical protein